MDDDALLRERRATMDRIVAFLRAIGLELRAEEVTGTTFVPGITLVSGAIVYDEARTLYPGDLLHEAGHLALKTVAERVATVDNAGADGGEEMGAMAWSYAATVHLGLAPEVVFHDAGYRGGSAAMLDAFRDGRGVGVPILQWRGLTADATRARVLGVPPYPQMIRWLRSDE